MIIYRRKEIKQEQFGDGTLKALVPENLTDCDSILGRFGIFPDSTETITWCYDNDAEIFTLRCLVDAIRDSKGNKVKIELCMPYIPHARQDRKVSGRFFTLKTFANMINEMEFDEVRVLDPHSDVSTALIDRIKELHKPYEFLTFENDVVFMYPDAGAAKKYKATNTAIIGNKHRNSEGRIERYELLNFVEGTKKVVVIDDICSYGGTFVEAAKELKNRGVETVVLVVSHCEDNILKGEVFNYIDKVYTTDSICHINHEKLEFISYLKFREVENEN